MPIDNVPNAWTRRRVLRTMFCSSAALALNVNPRSLFADEPHHADADDLHLIAIGDYGFPAEAQKRVADAMADYIRKLGIKPDALLLLGDNFYGGMRGGVKSERWKKGFEDMYPADPFDCVCPAVLGNHDYTDSGHEQQLGYAAHVGGKTRWHMPSRWYRLDLPEHDPVVSLICLDTNLPGVTPDRILKDKTTEPRLSEQDVAEQLDWLDTQLADRRAPWSFVLGHHPIYSNGAHGDNGQLIKHIAPLLAKHRAPLYLCGHDHDLQHLELEHNPTSFVLSGGGGAGVRPLRKDLARGPFAKPVYGFSHIQLSPKRFVLRQIDMNGRQLHAFTKLPSGRVIVEAS